MLQTKTILGVPVTVSPKEKILTYISQAIGSGKQLRIFTPNPEIVVLAQNDPQLLNALKQADINLPDGKGIGIATGVPVITGREFVSELFLIAQEKKCPVFILTGTKQALTGTIQKAQKEFPSLLIDGAVGPKLNKEALPISTAEESIEQKIIATLKKRQHLVFVGFGAPKQEKWIVHQAENVAKCSFMGVGGSFDYYSGVKALPPRWMAGIGLEWLWRLFQETGHFERVIRALVIFPLLLVLRKDRK